MLREEQVKEGCVRAIRVIGGFTSPKKEKILCETIDPKFAREPENLLKDFKPIAGPKPPR